MTDSDGPAKKYRDEASAWRRVAEAFPDVRRRMYWQRLADDYTALAVKVARLPASAAEPAE